MFLLIENSNGFTVLRRNSLKKNIFKCHDFEIHSIYSYQTRNEAIKSSEKLTKGKVPKNLKKFLKNNIKLGALLIVNDQRLKFSLKKKLKEHSLRIKKKNGIFRALRKNASKNFALIDPKKEKSKTLSIVHSLFGEKIKITSSKLDGMIVHAIKLVDELDRSINGYSMRLREWFGWHFPELSGLITDNILYAKTVSLIETRERIKYIDLSEYFSSKILAEIKEASEISLGADIFSDDLSCILTLSGQIIAFYEFRVLLEKYLKNRMYSLAPNLTGIIGDKIGARLIAHCSTLLNLSKYPASTIQILGAEKALFKALKNKSFTPKFGLIYHASLISNSQFAFKGKLSRMLAGKVALSARVDALGENKYGGSVGLKNRKKIEQRIKQMETFVAKKNII